MDGKNMIRIHIQAVYKELLGSNRGNPRMPTNDRLNQSNSLVLPEEESFSPPFFSPLCSQQQT